MNNLPVLLIGLLLSSFSAGAVASAEISQGQMDAIIAECKQESKDAVDPSVYIENCIDDRLQALRESTVQGEKEPS